MKNTKSSIAILVMAIVVFASITVVSCKKEKQEQATNNLEQIKNTSDDMNEYLISFKKRLLSAQKGDETISIEQAQRDFGNLLNFDFGDANYATNVFHRDTIHLELTTTEGLVDLSQLAQTYTKAYDKVKNAFDSVGLPEKTVFSIYCVFHPMSKNSETLDVELIVTTRGFDESKELRLTPSIYDCWSTFGGRGNCDGLFLGYDHVRVLQITYNRFHQPRYDCIYSLYFTDITQGDVFAHEYPETGLTSYNHGFRLWTDYEYPDTNDFVDSCEMVYYYNNMCSIIDEWMEALDDDDYMFLATSCSIHSCQDELSENDYVNGIHYCFTFKIEYGKPHCTNGFIDDY